jgi:hypothetical protein
MQLAAVTQGLFPLLFIYSYTLVHSTTEHEYPLSKVHLSCQQKIGEDGEQ